MLIIVSTQSLPPPPKQMNIWGDRLGGTLLGGGGGGNLQTDATQLFLFVPIPAKAKKLGLLSIYKFSLGYFIEYYCTVEHSHSVV
jgi:hypothetical protein